MCGRDRAIVPEKSSQQKGIQGHRLALLAACAVGAWHLDGPESAHPDEKTLNAGGGFPAHAKALLLGLNSDLSRDDSEKACDLTDDITNPSKAEMADAEQNGVLDACYQRSVGQVWVNRCGLVNNSSENVSYLDINGNVLMNMEQLVLKEEQRCVKTCRRLTHECKTMQAILCPGQRCQLVWEQLWNYDELKNPMFTVLTDRRMTALVATTQFDWPYLCAL
ncbi:hypothetical protein IRJ41_006929 [Triplophysa rosa]|uniref:Uncharacterized protein n=1 Tax=Triplophysa rosa TaxID=992332 RepID=A0A9W7TQK4_TRIRA|nr:hypothetical protein IRJ41_006929 [Triplophysa rosa]